jgi:hypothetical protein
MRLDSRMVGRRHKIGLGPALGAPKRREREANLLGAGQLDKLALFHLLLA